MQLFLPSNKVLIPKGKQAKINKLNVDVIGILYTHKDSYENKIQFGCKYCIFYSNCIILFLIFLALSIIISE